MTPFSTTFTMGGVSGLDNPLDRPYPRRDYDEGKVSARISYRRIWLDRYIFDGMRQVGYWSCELKVLSNGKCYLDGREIKNPDEAKRAREIVDSIKME